MSNQKLVNYKVISLQVIQSLSSFDFIRKSYELCFDVTIFRGELLEMPAIFRDGPLEWWPPSIVIFRDEHLNMFASVNR